MDPIVIINLKVFSIESELDLNEWLENGFSKHEAYRWSLRGFDLDEAIRWRDNGISLVDAQYYRLEDVDPEDAVSLIALMNNENGEE